jgi:hypothetical protein
MGIIRLTGTVKVSVTADQVRLLLKTEGGDDIELNLLANDASRFALDLSQAAALAQPTNTLTAAERALGYESVCALKVVLANYGMDRELEKIFLTLREEKGAEFSFALDKDECIRFARDVLLRISGQSSASTAKH